MPEPPGDDPQLSVVIPVRNGAATIDAQLGALATQDCAEPWELIVADNGSTDATLQRVERWGASLPCLRVVEAGARSGVSFARNSGIAAARAPRWALCDADDVVSPSWVRAMLGALRVHSLVTGPLDHRSLNRPSSLRPTHDLHARPTARGFLPYAFGCNVGATRRLFDEIGGFDDAFIGGGDDVDFCWRAQLHGADLHYEPEALVAYRHRAQLGDAWRQLHTYARCNPALYRRFREHGMPRSDARLAAKQWVWLALTAPAAPFGRRRLERWLRVSARRTGRLRGSIKARVFYP